MKRLFLSFTLALIALLGFLLIFGGFVILSSQSTPFSKDSGQRVLAVGLVLIGSSTLLWRKSDPDYVPEWMKRYFYLYFALGLVLLGLVVLALSWI